MEINIVQNIIYTLDFALEHDMITSVTVLHFRLNEFTTSNFIPRKVLLCIAKLKISLIV